MTLTLQPQSRLLLGALGALASASRPRLCSTLGAAGAVVSSAIGGIFAVRALALGA
jgi:hypothetical protein